MRKKEVILLIILIIVILAFLLLLIFVDYKTKEQTNDKKSLPNPAAVYCVEQGYKYEIKTNPDGSQYGVCAFPDGSECKGWAFYRGECQIGGSKLDSSMIGAPNPSAVYCEKLGYTYKINKKPEGEKGICIVNQGVKFKAWDFFKGKIGKEYSYCAKKGYDIETEKKDFEKYSTEYAVCVQPGKRISMKELMEQEGEPLIETEPSIVENEKGQEIEYKEIVHLISEDKEIQFSSIKSYETKSLPSSFDWRNKDGHTYIGPIRNQGACGSCYAFGVLASAEGTYNVAENLIDENCADFSEAFLAFCLSDYYAGFDGCSGANYEYEELDALVDEGMGICNESAFPYTDYEQPCYSPAWDVPRIEFDAWSRIETLNIDAMKTAIMTYGVIDVAVYASTAFQQYTEGIYSDSNTGCPDGYYTTVNHAVSLVGWGHDTIEGDYWILRNSWGDWGENGYMRIAVTSARVACAPTKLGFGLGRLEPYIINIPSEVEKDNFFTAETGVKCVDGPCGDISATLDPEIEIYYDDGTPATYYSDSNFIWAVRFTSPFYPLTITKAKVQFYDLNSVGSYTATVYVYDDNNGVPGNELISPFTTTINTFYSNWEEIDLNVPIISGDFWIGISAPGGNLNNPNSGPFALTDFGTTTYRSVGGDDSTWYSLGNDLMLRAFVEAEGYKGIIPMTSGTPFYTTSPNPQNLSNLACLQNMQAGDTCNQTWQVNATGEINTTWQFFTIYNSITYDLIEANKTEKTSVTIVEGGEFISITFEGPIDFGNLNPSTLNNPASENPYNITINPETTVEIDIYQKGDDYEKGTDKISIDDMKWNEINSPGDSITSTYSLIMEDIGIGDYDIYYWLDIPLAQYAGNYETTIYIKAVESGISP